nr:AAA-ATPase At3g28580-like [Ziziphus jujuba var. spinosa]
MGKDSNKIALRTTSERMKMVPARLTQKWATMASFMFVWAIVSQYLLPNELHRIIHRFKRKLKNYFDPYIKITIHEFTGERLRRSEAYASVEAYLSSITSKIGKRFKAEMETENSNLVLSLDENEEVSDEFQGAKLWWVLSKVVPPKSTVQRFCKLTFHKRYKEMVTNSYLQHVMRQGKEIRKGNRKRRIHSNCSGYKWSHTVFEHPASFETIAMDQDKKQEIIEDLLAFSRGKDYYARIGKAWKRGYLLYGPPGTGKTTMIAAMANLLNYDVYDLELTAVSSNIDLRRLLIETTSKSIIVIEDIDCSVDLTGQRKKRTEQSCLKDENKCSVKEKKEHKEEGDSSTYVTLSGLLNFIDGLWSSCGAERLIVFTTNYVEKLDPALIRRGRMDKHIEMSYCSFNGFKVLAKNYLDLENHKMFERIEKLMEETKITPADVAENLMPKSLVDDPERCLSNFIQVLEKVLENASAKKSEETELTKESNANGKAEAADNDKQSVEDESTKRETVPI